jgi:hypothetical protein
MNLLKGPTEEELLNLAQAIRHGSELVLVVHGKQIQLADRPRTIIADSLCAIAGISSQLRQNDRRNRG